MSELREFIKIDFDKNVLEVIEESVDKELNVFDFNKDTVLKYFNTVDEFDKNLSIFIEQLYDYARFTCVEELSYQGYTDECDVYKIPFKKNGKEYLLCEYYNPWEDTSDISFCKFEDKDKDLYNYVIIEDMLNVKETLPEDRAKNLKKSLASDLDNIISDLSQKYGMDKKDILKVIDGYSIVSAKIYENLNLLRNDTILKYGASNIEFVKALNNLSSTMLKNKNGAESMEEYNDYETKSLNKDIVLEALAFAIHKIEVDSMTSKDVDKDELASIHNRLKITQRELRARDVYNYKDILISLEIFKKHLISSLNNDNEFKEHIQKKLHKVNEQILSVNSVVFKV